MSVLSRFGLVARFPTLNPGPGTASTCHSRMPLLDHGRPLRCLIACDWVNGTRTSRRVHSDSTLSFTKPTSLGLCVFSSSDEQTQKSR